jgi:hypothetical protein
MVLAWGGQSHMVIALDAVDGAVARVFIQLNPVKLEALSHRVSLT